MQYAGGLHGWCHEMRAVTVLNMLHDLPTDDQDPDDPVAFINTDIKAAFQEMCRQVSYDTLTGKATQPYNDGRVQSGDDIPTIEELRPFLRYFHAMHSTASNNRYCNHRGHTHHVKGTTGGQQGDGLEMMCLSRVSKDISWFQIGTKGYQKRNNSIKYYAQVSKNTKIVSNGIESIKWKFLVSNNTLF